MIPCQEPKRGLIIHSGAIGDCVLALPLAMFLKQACGVEQVHFLGRPDAIGFYPKRSGIDHVRAMANLPLHRLFVPADEFVLEDLDRLIGAFSGYEQIVNFLGSEHPDFEQNLLMTVHCSHSAEVTTLPLAPPMGVQKTISRFYIEAFACILEIEPPTIDLTASWLTPLPDDYAAGQDLLEQAQVNPDARIVLLHPGSGGRYKCWHPENFLTLAYALREDGFEPVFLLGPAEQERLAPETILRFRSAGVVLSELTLTEVFAVLTQADMYVGNDSGISHIAGAMGRRTIAVFGASDPTLYRPLGPNVTVFTVPAEQLGVPCPEQVGRLLALPAKKQD